MHMTSYFSYYSFKYQGKSWGKDNTRDFYMPTSPMNLQSKDYIMYINAAPNWIHNRCYDAILTKTVILEEPLF